MGVFINKKELILFSLFLFDLLVLILSWYFFEYRLFNIDTESNLPTIYQSLKLLFLIQICLIYFILEQKINGVKKALNIFPFYLFTLYLSLDELGQIHENLPTMVLEIFGVEGSDVKDFFVNNGFNSWAYWMIFYAPFGLLFFIYLFILIKNYWHEWKTFILYPILSCVAFVFIFILEYIGTNELDQVTGFTLKTIIHLEEGLEMFSISMLVIFFVNLVNDKIKKVKFSKL